MVIYNLGIQHLLMVVIFRNILYEVQRVDLDDGGMNCEVEGRSLGGCRIRQSQGAYSEIFLILKL